MTEKKQTGDNKWITVLSFLLAASVALNIILFMNDLDVFPAKRELVEANASLTKQVQKYKSEINKYSGISSKIDGIIADANLKMEAKEKQISSLKRERWAREKENQALTLQLDSIQEMYLGAIDSLLVQREKTKVINSKIEVLEETISGLNVKIGQASILLGDNLNILPLKKNSNGKKQATAMAKKTAELELCFDLLENRLSKSETKSIFYVITSPNAEVIVDGQGEAPIFYNPDYKTNALCSKIEKVEYKNQKLHVCTVIRPNNQLSTGLYVVEVFSSDRKLGMTTFTLR